MKILVCISKAPDTTSKIAFTNNNTSFDENGVQYIVNPYDEWYALVRAIELVEKDGGSVTVINVGPADNEQFIRKALAIGADDAIRIDAEANDGVFVSRQIANFAKDKGYDLVVRLSGEFETAFPDGNPADKKEDEEENESCRSFSTEMCFKPVEVAELQIEAFSCSFVGLEKNFSTALLLSPTDEISSRKSDAVDSETSSNFSNW